MSGNSKRELTKKFAKQYFAANKQGKSEILDLLEKTSNWNRKYAMEVLKKTNERRGRPKKDMRGRFSRTPSYTPKIIDELSKIWILTGSMNSKALSAQMSVLIEALERYKEIDLDEDSKKQLLSISAATIDRRLKKLKDSMEIRGRSTTKPGNLLRNSITVRKATDEMEKEAGFLELDTVAHCGNTLKGEFSRSITATDVYTGWTENVCIRNNAHSNILNGLEIIEKNFPYSIRGFDTDNGSEFINQHVIKWVNKRDLYFTRSRPYKKNDNAHVEQKNYDIVRRLAFYYRYDTEEECILLNKLYRLSRLRYNFFTPTRKAISYSIDSVGRRKRVYEKYPKSPYQRLIEIGNIDECDKVSLKKQFLDINPAEITRKINRIQTKLIKLAKSKPESLELPLANNGL